MVRTHRQAEFPGKVVADFRGRDAICVCLHGAQRGIPERQAWLRRFALLGEGLAVPANISLLFLPTYSPELNPAEELWHELRRHFLANRVIDTVEDRIEACCNAALQKPGFIKSVTGFAWLPSLNRK